DAVMNHAAGSGDQGMVGGLVRVARIGRHPDGLGIRGGHGGGGGKGGCRKGARGGFRKGGDSRTMATGLEPEGQGIGLDSGWVAEEGEDDQYFSYPARFPNKKAPRGV